MVSYNVAENPPPHFAGLILVFCKLLGNAVHSITHLKHPSPAPPLLQVAELEAQKGHDSSNEGKEEAGPALEELEQLVKAKDEVRL